MPAGLFLPESGGSQRGRAVQVGKRVRGALFLLSLLAMVAAVAAHSPALARSARPNSGPAVIAARIAGDQMRTRFIADLNRPVGFNVYILADPFRAVIDLPEIGFRLPPGIGAAGRGLVKAYRYGRIGDKQARIVMDLAGPALIQKSFVIDPREGQPARMVVDLVATDRATFARLNRDAGRDLAEQGGDSVPRPRPKPDGSPPPTGEQPDMGEKDRESPGRKVIVLDPGHGGLDPGAASRSGTLEKDVVLAFARVVKENLEATQRYNVLMTRDSDSFISLADRVRFARNHHADLLIAIHADALRGRTVRGATVYTLSEKASDAEAQALAEKENGVDILAGVAHAEDSEQIAGILIDLTQRETKNSSVFLARRLVRQLEPVTLLTGHPHRSAGFRVLKAPDVPSVLLELGYLSNRADEKLLGSAEWRRKMAKAMVGAIDSYFGQSKGAPRTESAAR
jgi:N-acetylmuramoyl-L-alanine amidase